MSDHTKHDNDEPQYSSAAQCISLRILGHDFIPEYTHQCFDGEWIRGYQPPHPVERPHESHANHEVATHELQAIIVLSPSCAAAHVDLIIRGIKRKQHEGVERQRKRCKLFKMEDECASSEIDEEDDEEYEDPNGDNEDDHSNAGRTRHRRMHPDEILERLRRALPDLSRDKAVTEGEYLRQPVGKVLKTYARPTIRSGGDGEFILTIADSQQAADYHSMVQNLAIFFIESADGVNLHQSNAGGYWKVMYLFQKHGTRRYSLCGFLTLFHFHSPFRKPSAGIIMRICQALLLPPYQRQGHGKVMLRAVHEIAMQSDQIVEINVEDPAPGFVALRNRVDYELLVDSIKSDEPWLPPRYLEGDRFPTLQEQDRNRAATLGRITPRQVQIAYELYKLDQLPLNGDEKQYRLMVKKRLLKHHRERLSMCKTKEERQILLAEMWREVLAEYRAILKRK
jgi:GNAT superfamily N-acetyltransferase